MDVSVTEVNVTENAAMTEQPSTSRNSVRKSCKYKSSKDDRKCIVCNKIKYAKGRTVPLLGITLKKSEEGSQEAEKTLKEFAKIHLHNNNETYKESANRIILTTSITTLFAADVSYHKQCYQRFRSPWWKKKYNTLNVNEEEYDTGQIE